MGTRAELDLSVARHLPSRGGESMRSLSLLIADDHEIVRIGLRNLLAGQPGWSVVAEAADGREAVERAKATKPDIAVLDTGMPILNGLEAARQIIKSVPETKILLFTMNDSELLIQEALTLGIRAFILKSDPTVDLLAAVQALRDNQTLFTPKVAQIVLDGFRKRMSRSAASRSPLTALEREIIKLLAEGKNTREVASLLNVSTRTAEAQRANLMCRLDCHSVVELLHYCIRNKIVEVNRDQGNQEVASVEDRPRRWPPVPSEIM